MIRDITIHAVLNGFVVKVGCQTLAFTSISELTTRLGDYLRNPEEVEKIFSTISLNARHTYGDGPTQPPPPPEFYTAGNQESNVGGLVGGVGGQLGIPTAR